MAFVCVECDAAFAQNYCSVVGFSLVVTRELPRRAKVRGSVDEMSAAPSKMTTPSSSLGVRPDEASHSSEFFSPIGISFFQQKDHTWIGARLSPIQSFDKEMDEERATERTRLVHSKIHPLWNSPKPKQFGFQPKPLRFGTLLVIFSGLHLLAMGIYDVYRSYWELRRGSTANAMLHLWTLPYLIPPDSTLYIFGMLNPTTKSLVRRLLTTPVSCGTTTSVVAYFWLVASWRLLYISSRQIRRKRDTPRRPPPAPWHEFTLIYICSVLAGHLWLAVDQQVQYVGAATWGTSGVLCAAGMARPSHRFELFCLAAVALIGAALVRPYDSCYGSLGGALMGWALGATGVLEVQTSKLISLLGTAAAVAILVAPVLVVGLQQ